MARKLFRALPWRYKKEANRLESKRRIDLAVLKGKHSPHGNLPVMWQETLLFDTLRSLEPLVQLICSLSAESHPPCSLPLACLWVQVWDPPRGWPHAGAAERAAG